MLLLAALEYTKVIINDNDPVFLIHDMEQIAYPIYFDCWFYHRNI